MLCTNHIVAKTQIRLNKVYKAIPLNFVPLSTNKQTNKQMNTNNEIESRVEDQFTWTGVLLRGKLKCLKVVPGGKLSPK